ncbi:MAG: hypothetical protein ACNYVW_09910, partial [Methanosarcinales archaeon]
MPVRSIRPRALVPALPARNTPSVAKSTDRSLMCASRKNLLESIGGKAQHIAYTFSSAYSTEGVKHLGDGYPEDLKW